MKTSARWEFIDKTETIKEKFVEENKWIVELDFADGSMGYETEFTLHIWHSQEPEENTVYFQELESIRFLQRTLAEIEEKIKKHLPHLDNDNS